MKEDYSTEIANLEFRILGLSSHCLSLCLCIHGEIFFLRKIFLLFLFLLSCGLNNFLPYLLLSLLRFFLIKKGGIV